MKRFLFTLVLSIMVMALLSVPARAQAPVAGAYPGNPPMTFSPEELDHLVGRIALYPDELLGIVLAASTYPLHVVQAARYLEDLKREPFLSPREEWDPSILGLLNYPEVIYMMNEDLDWTSALGDAVYSQNNDVMAAIQHFRYRAYTAGNLRTNSRQIVIVEGRDIIIRSVDPETVYVPRYDPNIVIVRRATPPIIIYSDPYPLYYYPVAPFFTGWFLGYGISFGVGWHNHNIFYHHHYYPNYNYHHRHKFSKPYYYQHSRQPYRTPRFKPRSIPDRYRDLSPGKRTLHVWSSDRDSTRKPGFRPGTRSKESPSRFREPLSDTRFPAREPSRQPSGQVRESPRTSSSDTRPPAREPSQPSGNVRERPRTPSSESGPFSNYERGYKEQDYSNRGQQSRSESGNYGRSGRSSGRSSDGGRSRQRER